ncbi:MAG TPA: RNA polymerase factor sigma-54 [Terriglobales bacterium]|nr:RNA polymerase factor sigma-54 [Terriglobales bacterium]
MVLLQPRLNLRVSQKQILTPGLVQMVSVLALNKLELKDMINAEIMENPILEELDSQVPLLDEIAGRQEKREREEVPEEPVPAAEKKDPFDEIDFGSFFQNYLDPGYRSPQSEEIDKPSFENFLSRPATLTDHLMWQLGAMSVRPEVHEAAELIIGNLNEDGYLTASDEELLGLVAAEAGVPLRDEDEDEEEEAAATPPLPVEATASAEAPPAPAEAAVPAAPPEPPPAPAAKPAFDRAALHEAIELVRQMDPPGVAARDLRECLLAQLRYHQQVAEQRTNGHANGNGVDTSQVLADALALVDTQLHAVQNKQYREAAKAMGRPVEAVMQAIEYVRTLDPKPGLRYNRVEPKLIEPDVAFVKQGDEYLVLMNDDDVPQLRLNPAYCRLLGRGAAEKDVRTYVKERYKSAIQLIKNIEQRKQTILKVCHAIIGRQRDFLDRGIDQLKPMMIKEVAEEIGVHPSTVSRAVASKYAHTPQGVFELRYFFSESVQGPEGGGTSLLILKRRVKKLIEEEDSTRPLTDEQITRILQSQGIQVTRRTVAKYREDMRIPSTHQRRVKN